ncbi:MAG: arginine--tRNA ligase [Chloroflexi bacterium]|nr:arginine--tRNA ligase [Chloroflexota bacterium]MCL5076242.1 arginine--tRNA ligase [Chloroflexota bacterium]
MIKGELVHLLRKAGERAKTTGALPDLDINDIPIECPSNPAYGDYASSLPLKLARAARLNPLSIAKILADHLPRAELVGKLEVAPPGFLNFTLSDAWLAKQVDVILEAGPDYGRIGLGRGAKIQIEFGSANPTGPLTAAFGRGGTLGDVLGNILTKAGYRVTREYYVNDAGSRMDAFNNSIYARYLQQLGQTAQMPTDGYYGHYMIDLAKEIVAEYGHSFQPLPPEQAAAELGKIAMTKILNSARSDLAALGINYDVWFSEQSLFERSLVDKTLEMLRERGYLEEREGAIWFASTAMGEDKDNVLVRSTGIPTYFATDIAYHYDKFVERGFEWVIDIWGADHQGHVPRMKAAIAALGIPEEKLRIIIHQMVTLRRGAEIVRMSKRSGDLITLGEVLDEVGADACRFFFLSRSADSQMDFDLDLAKTQSAENPVYYVQYAHARIASILRYAGERDLSDADLRLLRKEPELLLIKKMLLLPELVETIAQQLEPHLLPYYAQDLATVFHAFYKQCRVVSKDQALSKARLKLVRAAKIVLANTLNLMGIHAPDHM